MPVSETHMSILKARDLFTILVTLRELMLAESALFVTRQFFQLTLNGTLFRSTLSTSSVTSYRREASLKWHLDEH